MRVVPLLVLLLSFAWTQALPCMHTRLGRRAFIALPISAGLATTAPPVSGKDIASSCTLSAAPNTVLKSSASSEFLSGLVAGAAQKTVKELALHPFDTVKTRLQLTSTRRGLLDPLLYTDAYSGIVPALVSGAPAASVFFAVKDAALQQLKPSLGKTGGTVAAVGTANVFYWMIRNPTEVIKVRRQSGGVSDSRAAAVELWDELGPTAFYRGYTSNVAYAFPVDASKFVLYAALKDAWRTRKGGAKLTALEAAVGGALSSMTAQGIATPLDVARTRIMTKPADEPAQSVVASLREVIVEEGPSGLYRGLTPKAARALASGALQFSVLETVKDAVNRALLGSLGTPK